MVSCFIGFIGIIVISEPGFSALNYYYIYPIIFCLGLSYVAIAIRKLSTTEPSLAYLFFFFNYILSFFTFYNWIMPTLRFIFIINVGILGGLQIYC